MLIGIAIVAVTLAVVASIVAWRAVREERRRSEARVALLAREIHGTPDGLDLDLRSWAGGVTWVPTGIDGGGAQGRTEQGRARAALTAQPMFATVAPARTGSRVGLALALVGFVAASIGAAAIVLTGAPPTAVPVARESPSPGPTQSITQANREAPNRPAAPLELVALVHERDGDTLTVRGTIRNPTSGSEMSRLTAVVFLFDRDGGFLASGRAAVDSPSLIPGGESAFAVSVPAAGAVARYRVSFRSGDRIVSHVDRRSRS